MNVRACCSCSCVDEDCRVPAFAGPIATWLLVNSHLGIDVTETFNPYHEWLGIPPDVRHPNYYELLQVDSRENDEAAIRTAAERAAARVRNFRPGKEAAAWAGLLDEIAKAKTCLTDATARAAYDRRIHSPNTAASKSVGHSPEPEIAPVNQNANLYPPGMAPPAANPPANPPENPPANRSPKTSSPSVGSKKAKPKTTRKKKNTTSSSAKQSRPTKNKPAQPTSPKTPTSKPSAPASAPKPADKPTPKQIETPGKPNADQVPVDTPQPTSKPVNAHVAPPPEEKPSQWLLIIPVTAVIVLLTLLVLYIALFAGT